MSDLTTRLDATAREALGALLAYHRGHITRIEAALEALDGPVVPLVRPPAPDTEIAAPVEMPKVPQREQRPAAKANGAKYDDDKLVACARAAFDRGESMSRALQSAFGMSPSSADTKLSTLRKKRDDVPRTRTAEPPKPLPESTPSRTIPPLVSTVPSVAATGSTTVVYRCVTCSEAFDSKQQLANHTIAEHRRGPMQAENAGVAA